MFSSLMPYTITINKQPNELTPPIVDIFSSSGTGVVRFHNAREVVAFFGHFAEACEIAFGVDELQDAWDEFHEEETEN